MTVSVQRASAAKSVPPWDFFYFNFNFYFLLCFRKALQQFGCVKCLLGQPLILLCKPSSSYFQVVGK